LSKFKEASAEADVGHETNRGRHLKNADIQILHTTQTNTSRRTFYSIAKLKTLPTSKAHFFKLEHSSFFFFIFFFFFFFFFCGR
jgi:hypothetical protein